MSKMDRREFMQKSALAISGAWGAHALASESPATRPAVTTRPVEKFIAANDDIILGKTGIKTSRLAIGTGTMGGKEQKDVGVQGMVKLFRYALDQNVRWWDTATTYATNPHVAAALKEIKRDKVVITTKTRKRDPKAVRKDIDNIRKTLGTDYLDIVLLHCLTDPDWRNNMKGVMDALSEEKEKGHIRAVGCSCHSFGALEATADEPWIEVNLARINPYAIAMDVGKPEQVSRVERVLRKMHKRGKAIYGMKILGAGAINGDRINNSLRFALNLPYVSGFTIGFSKPEQIDDIIARTEKLRVTTRPA
jgi:predicted aldo/keto reductase-like oxidoreductase